MTRNTIRMHEMRVILAPLLALSIVSCASNAPSVSGSETFGVLPGQAVSPSENDPEYVIGATDVLNITTFQVPDLTLKEVRVDASGRLQMPLIGSIQASGLTPAQLGEQIERLLGERYLRDPQVTISVAEAASQKITVDGAVSKPGVYEMRGATTLLQAVAMAEGPVRTADLTRVAVFRDAGDQRMVALFDLAAIRAGQATDPQLLGNDIVVVDTSQLSMAMRDVLAALPGLAVFGVFQ